MNPEHQTEQQSEPLPKERGAGRKPKQESRATELRERLLAWKQIPESSRPSLRALARELGTSHQMLAHCLTGLEKCQADEFWRRAKEIRAQARAAGRPMTPWEAEQARVFDRRAMCLFIEVTFEEHANNLDREIEQGIRNGKAPAAATAKMLKLIASTRGGPAAQRAAQRAQVVLQKYFSPEGQKAIRERVRNAVRPARAVPKLPQARYHEIRLQKIVERFEEIGGALLLDEGQVLYFVPQETAVSRVLLSELVNYRKELKTVLELNPGKVDFGKVKAEICQRFPPVSLSPLDSYPT